MGIRRFRPSAKAVCLVAVATLLVAAFAGAAWSSNPGTGTAPVREQNVDSNGAIRVHEQGTADVRVTNGSVPVSVGNFPETQQVAGTVNVGNLPNTQQVAGTVNVGNLPSTQNVNVVGGNLATAPTFVNAAFQTGLMSIDKLTSERVELTAPIYATTISVNLADKEHTQVTFEGAIPGCGMCEVLVLDLTGSDVETLPFPARIDEIHVFCVDPGQFLNECLPQIFISGLKV